MSDSEEKPPAVEEPAAERSEEEAAGPADEKKTIRVATVGCSHGELDTIYATIRKDEQRTGRKVDVLLCCGDFQAMRNEADLDHFHCPEKYKQLGCFAKYYSEEKTAPVLTIMIGGNHENAAYSMELPHGGWLAPNIFYLGFASVVNYGGLRIGGWSGIFKQQDYGLSHYEAPPFPYGQHISSYHVRSLERFRLGLLADEKAHSVDVFLSHDWPNGITKHGDERWLLNHKKHFREDVQNNRLGNPHSMSLLRELRPRHWFAAHLHVKFEANVEHHAVDERPPASTKFLALHKCIPKFPTPFFYEILDIEVESPLSNELRYDVDWLAVLRKTKHFENAAKVHVQIPARPADFRPTDDDRRAVEELFDGDLRVPANFRPTAEPHGVFKRDPKIFGAQYYCNPQSSELCEKLGIPDLNKQLCQMNHQQLGNPYFLQLQATKQETNESEIILDDVDYGDDEIYVDNGRPPTPSKKRRASSPLDGEPEEKKRAEEAS